jgi:predicted DNA-binding transcriptional regulator YafY
MKSSRLISIVLLLQANERMTADELAEELEVSVRTIYRDIDSLQEAGIPLYAEAGHYGGYRLVGGYRTRLTGLNAGEAEALLLSSISGPATDLGLGPALAAAQLKLEAALPPDVVAQAVQMRSRFHFDPIGWYAELDDNPHLAQVADAVWQSRTLQVRYRRWKEPQEITRRIDPWGLVLKAGTWYVVAGPGPRTYRVDQILELAVDTGFDPPEGFDLAEFWRRNQEEFFSRVYQHEAVVRLSSEGATRLSGGMARACAATGTQEPDGWIRARLPIESIGDAHREFLAFGADIEVLEPVELRMRLTETSRALSALYATDPGGGGDLA